MFVPRFSITNKILKNIGQIEASKEVIENAPLVPHFEKKFVNSAMLRTVFHGTHIEGNSLTFDQTKRVLEGEQVVARDRDVQEVINYRQVVSLLDEYKNQPGYNIDMLLQIQRMCVFRIVQADKIGQIRQTQVVIKNENTGEIILQPPPAVEVKYLIEDFLAWLNTDTPNELHPVILAGIAHYILVAIHPFIEGNGRTARAFATLILMKQNYDIKNFFSLEEHFDNDPASYYEAFSEVDKQSPQIAARDMTPWLEYFTEVVAVELTKIKERVRKMSMDMKMRTQLGQQVALTGRQMTLAEYLSENGKAKMKELKNVLPMVSEDTILRDLKDMMQKGVIKKQGSTKASRYVFVNK